ncbi:MAG: BON domain-containing protein [Myxococcales bacterium]|nr:BON domain-containing protein [Myxococcales bacterium]
MKPHPVKPRRARNPFHEAPEEPDPAAPPEGGKGAPYGFEEHGQRPGPDGTRDLDTTKGEAKRGFSHVFVRSAVEPAHAPRGQPSSAPRVATPTPSRRAEDHGDTRTADERLLDDVSEYLFMGDVDATDIDVTVAGADVTLTGSVTSEELKQHLEHLVSAVPGVAHVECQVRVKLIAHRPRAMPVRLESPTARPSWPNQFTTSWASPPTR